MSRVQDALAALHGQRGEGPAEPESGAVLEGPQLGGEGAAHGRGHPAEDLGRPPPRSSFGRARKGSARRDEGICQGGQRSLGPGPGPSGRGAWSGPPDWTSHG